MSASIPKTASSLIDGQLIYNKITRRDALRQAFERVSGNNGSSGGDGVTIEQFARRLDFEIARLSLDLLEGNYRPSALRSVDVPKKNGKGLRRLIIPAIRDRLVQTALAQALTPHFEHEFEDSSFGYRPNRSVKQAVERISASYRDGFTHVVDADIEGYFDSIPHDLLMKRFHESVSHSPVSELISLWLAHAFPYGRGIAQGSPLSPLLSNLYLDRLDEAFNSKTMRLIRFADDFVVLTKEKYAAEEALVKIDRKLWDFGLKLNKEKTTITHFDKGFQFLGTLFMRSLAFKQEGEDDFQLDAALKQVALRDEELKAEKEKEDQAEINADSQGYSPRFRTLYVTHKQRRLNLRNQSLTVEELQPALGLPDEAEKWQELIRLPPERAKRIELYHGAGITSEALSHVVGTGAALSFVNGHGETSAMLAPTLSSFAKRHLAQARFTFDEEKRVALARILVESRLRNQRTTLRRLINDKKPTSPHVTTALATLTSLIGRGDVSRVRHAPSIAVVMGYEGQGAAHYWKALGTLAEGEFFFTKRVRREDNMRQAPDKANIALNFLCFLLHRDVSAAVLAAGLHPGFGALHSVDNNHDACVYDVMEEFRVSLVESLFVYLTTRKILRPEMFSEESGKVRMNSLGVEALIKGYEARLDVVQSATTDGQRMKLRSLMVDQAHALAKHYETAYDETPRLYKPFLVGGSHVSS